MQAPTPPPPPLVPPPTDAPASGTNGAPAGPQALDRPRNGPPRPPAPPAAFAPPEGHGVAPPPVRDRAAAMDTTWFGATGLQDEVAPEPAPSAMDSPLVARYRASSEKETTKKAERSSARKGRPSKPVFAAWLAGGAVVAAAVIVALVIYLTGGTDSLAPAPDEAASILPTRLAGLSVELDKHPRVLEGVPYRRDGAGIVVTDPKRAGAGGYAAAIVLEPSAAGGGDFQTSFEEGLRSDGKVGEFSDTVLDAVGFRTAEVSGTPDISRVWWYKPYRDAVVVVYASDETVGRRILEGLVDRNSTG